MPHELDRQIDALVRKQMGPTLAKLGRSVGWLLGGSAKGRSFAAGIEKNLRLALRQQLVGGEAELIRDLKKIGTAGYTPLKGQGRALLVDRDGCPILSFDKKKITKPYSSTPTPPITAKDHTKEALQFEETKDFMYLDIKGNVTVGIGHLIPNEDAASRMPFTTTRDGGLTDKKHIKNGFNKVLGEFNNIRFKDKDSEEYRHNNVATYFENLTTLRLPEEEI